MQTQSGDVAVTLTDFVATVEIQRPPHNLLDIDLLRALATAFESLDDEVECRVLVLASAGQHFCAGAHFQYLQGEAEQQTWSAEAGNPMYTEVVRLHACRKPVIGGFRVPQSAAALVWPSFLIFGCCVRRPASPQIL